MFTTNKHDVVEFFQHILQTISLQRSAIRRTAQKEDPERSHKKRIFKILLDMGQGNDTGRGERGRTGRQGASGRGGCGRNALATVPCKASEQGACKYIKGHIFIIGSGNKGKDGDMLRTSKEKMATYIGTKYGDNAAQE
jgi:hypothetical protein